MTSYITRLAIAHSVSCNDIYKRVIAEVAKDKFRDFDIPPISRKSLDLFASFPWKLIKIWEKLLPIIDALECLTGHTSLIYLTTLPYGFDCVSKKHGRMKRHASWCPYCYQEWKDRNLILYEPLVWLVDDVKLCPVHWSQLSDQCPHCHSMLKYFNHVRFIGYCYQCGEWLGRYDLNHGENQIKALAINTMTCEEFDTYRYAGSIKTRQRQFLFGRKNLRKNLSDE